MKRVHRSIAAGGALWLLAATAFAGSIESPWSEVPEGELAAGAGAGERWIVPERARYLRLDAGALAATLAILPSESAAPRGLDGVELAIPGPDGALRRYRLVDSPVMAPELGAQYPEWRTFRMFDLEDARYGGRGDWTAHGFHAMVRTPSGTLFVDPLRQGDTELYQAYFKADLPRGPGQEFRCDTVGAESAFDESPDAPEAPAGGLDLRTYRLVVAATGEYTQFHGGTVGDGMAAIVTAVNRVNEVYERDVAIRMILVANNNLVVYTNGATDPYTNSSGISMLGQNQSNVDAVIGSANYDLGHVFSTGGGGVASLGVTCAAGSKARGVTGLPSPIGDPFYIDYVAHEMGHQWGGNHTFNSTASSCNGNRVSSAAYEVGSGSTIMAYAGICGAENLQPNSDPYFHRKSLDEIEAFSRTGNGNTCKAVVAQGNLEPSVSAGADYTIPKSTPFALTGSASDPDGGTLDYCWEEFDLGAASPPFPPTSGSAPMFRSFNPVSSPTRTFPKIPDIVNNTTTFGEALPNYSRTLKFRLTARDNQLPAGEENFDETVITVTSSAGPFQVTAPNSAVVWNGPGPHTVTWSVANTNLAPVSCATVDVDLSTDGGFTFDQSLAVKLPNDGSDVVYTGAADTATARVRVACHGNIFFDISNVSFTISGADVLIFADSFESNDTSRWSLTGTEP